jgi:muramoyltetrapeptide carboxypeptidase
VDLSGTVWGGNLAMLVSLLGTPYFPPIERRHLFIEDISEHPYRVERMVLQLILRRRARWPAGAWCWAIFQATS